MKRIFLAVNTVIMMTSLTVNAEGALPAVGAENALAPPDMANTLKQKAAVSDKGVIVMLTDRGEIAAEAAFLLASQLEQNPGFAPMLMVAEQERLQAYMNTLAVRKESLPAMIFFDKSGREMGRVVGAQLIAANKRKIVTAAY